MDTVWFILMNIGVISGVVGLMFRRLEKKMDKQEKLREEKDDARFKHEVMMIDLTMVSLSLSEATAEAVQRIPDANCNGEMKQALDYAKSIKQKYRDFEREQVVKAVS